MIRFPNAKINLGLNIVERRNDGYHNIETIFYPIPLNDIVEIVPSHSGTTTLHVSGNTVDCPPEKNLVMKAYNEIGKDYTIPAVDIFLHKHIPDGAGLGGGSSDASSVLIILNEIAKLSISNDSLALIASQIGADCPFFIYNKPLLATGIGNQFTPIEVSLAGKFLLLIKPDVSVPTALAYSKVNPKPSTIKLTEIVNRPIGEWKNLLKNDFELSVFSSYPKLENIKQTLYDAGAVYASMSGSGSSIFGIFESDIMAETIKSKFPDYDCFLMNL